MGVKETLAARNVKRFRWAVLRPLDPERCKVLLEKLPHPHRAGEMSNEQFQQIMQDALKGDAIFVGYLKPKCMNLFDGKGFRTGGKLQAGDVLDDFDEFTVRCQDGTYRKLENQQQGELHGR